MKIKAYDSIWYVTDDKNKQYFEYISNRKKIENNIKENIYYKSKQKYMLLLKCLININKEIKFSRIKLNNDNYSLKRRVNNKIECRQLKQWI